MQKKYIMVARQETKTTYYKVLALNETDAERIVRQFWDEGNSSLEYLFAKDEDGFMISIPGPCTNGMTAQIAGCPIETFVNSKL